MKPVILKNQGAGEFGSFAAVPKPIGDPVTHVRTAVGAVPDTEGVKLGIWEATPGRWERVIVQSEFSYFISGHCFFTPAGSTEAIEIQAGDSVYFPENSLGVWDIVEPTKKAFAILR
jgi:uncharacterized cupin superfamily protein